MSFQQKNVIVTGAAGDLGSATVARLLAAGARVFAVDRNVEALADLAAKHAGKGDLTTHVADVTVEADVAAYAKAAAKDRPVDAFFNNAGIQIRAAPITETAVEDFDLVQTVNVRGLFLGLKHVLPVIADGGAVVNSSSALGLVGAPGVAAYSTSKHAIVGLTRVAALEQGARGVRVNAIAPGPIAGRMTFTLEDQVFQGNGQTFADGAPLRRHGTPDEVAALVMYLLSDDARYTTGSVHPIDGGFTAS